MAMMARVAKVTAPALVTVGGSNLEGANGGEAGWWCGRKCIRTASLM